MTRKVSLTLDVPADLARLRLPRGVSARLQQLLDLHDQERPLSRAERAEAEGLVELSELLSLLRLRAEAASKPRKKRGA